MEQKTSKMIGRGAVFMMETALTLPVPIWQILRLNLAISRDWSLPL